MIDAKLLFSQDELERAMRYNTEGKERLNKEHAKSLDLSSQLQLSQNELQAMSVANNLLREVEATHLAKIQELMDNKVALESELSKESNFLAAATSKTSVVEDQLESIVKGRDFEIIEVRISFCLANLLT
jgi:conjugal transfer/entry exclusion protein